MARKKKNVRFNTQERKNAQMPITSTLEYGIFINKELAKRPNTEIAKDLGISSSTVSSRSKTPTYEMLRKIAYKELNEVFEGNLVREWAGLVYKLAHAKRKSDEDFPSIMAAVNMINNVCSLTAPKVDKVEHSVKMMDTRALTEAILETDDEYIEGEIALPHPPGADEPCSEDDTQGP